MISSGSIVDSDARILLKDGIMFVAGVDGCRAGWVSFKVTLPSLTTSVEVVDLSSLLRNRPSDLACLGIDIPIGLLDGSRACDLAARKLLGQPRGTSVFAAPCRAALAAKNHAEASAINRQKTTSGLSQQACGIAPKIKQVDDAITPELPAVGVRGSPGGSRTQLSRETGFTTLPRCVFCVLSVVWRPDVRI